MYSCHFFLILSASVRYLPFFALYCAYLCMKCSLGVSNFLKEISTLSPSIVFLHFFCIVHLRLSYLWNSAFSWVYLSLSPLPYASLLFMAFCKVSSNNLFAFLHLFFLGTVWVTISCTILQSSIHSSSGTLSIRYSPLNIFVTSTV